MSVNLYINFEVLLERPSEKFLIEDMIYGRYVHIHILSMLLEDRVKTPEPIVLDNLKSTRF